MGESELQKILPPDTEISRSFWEGCLQGELRLQHCESCERFQFYPRTICNGCGGDDLGWQSVSGRGRLASFSIVRRGISKAYPAPYVVVLVDLEEGVRMMSKLIECEPEKIAIGAEVEVLFEDWGAGKTLPVFRLREK